MHDPTIPLGFEIGTGVPVSIPLRHMAVTGQTQESGKTTTLEALITRSELRAIAFITKRGESSFSLGTAIEPFFQAADSNNELLSIEWPDEVDEDGGGQLLDVFFKFCDEHSISIGQQIILLALFEAAGTQIEARISEHDFSIAMEHMKELSGGKVQFTTMQGYSDEPKGK